IPAPWATAGFQIFLTGKEHQMHPAEPDGFEVGPVPIDETAERGLPALLLRNAPFQRRAHAEPLPLDRLGRISGGPQPGRVVAGPPLLRLCVLRILTFAFAPRQCRRRTSCIGLAVLNRAATKWHSNAPACRAIPANAPAHW